MDHSLTRRKLKIAISCLVLATPAGRAVAGALDPNSFTSLGALSLTSGSITINTDTLSITGAAGYSGVSFDQGSYVQNGVTDFDRNIAVFDFTSVNIGAGVVVNVAGSRPLAILSRGNLMLSSNVNLNGGNGSGGTAGAGGAGGGGAGGSGGFPTGAPGVGPGAAGAGGLLFDGGGAGFGGAGGPGATSSVGGAAYGDLTYLLQGGSGGHGAQHFASPGGGGGGALELGAVGFLTLNGNVSANGGLTPFSNYDGGGGSGGAVLLHGGAISLGTPVSAQGGSGLAYGGGGGGGRVTALAGSLTATQIQALLATRVNAGTSAFGTSGRAGVLVIRPDSTTVQAGESLSLTGTSTGQTGPNDPYVELHSGNLWVQGGGIATIASYDGLDYGADLTVDGILNLSGNYMQPATLAGAGQIHMGGGQIYLGYGSGGTGSFTGSITGNGYFNNQSGQLTLGGNASVDTGFQIDGGVVRVVGPNVYLSGFYINPDGELRVTAGGRLNVGTGFGTSQSAGKISVLGGSGPGGLAEAEFSDYLTNYASTGAIIVRGESNVLFTGGMGNYGAIAVAFANSNVFGDVTNYSGGQISISGNSNVLFGDDIINDGSIDVATGSTAVFLGSFGGAHGISGGGNVHFAGDLRPGHSPASISFGGNVTLESSARTEIELGGLTPGTQHDKITVAGHVDLDGAVAVRAIDGFTPLPGESFQILAFGSRSGDVDILDETGFAGLSFSKVYTSTSLSLNASGLPGDANLDGVVDIRDLYLLASHYSSAGAIWTSGDFNHDGLTNAADLGLLAHHWQAGVGAPLGESLDAALSSLGLPLVSVPESGIISAALGLAPFFWMGRRRRKC